MSNTFRVIATGDLHYDILSERFGECARVQDWTAELVEREKPDSVLCGGDVYERTSTPDERLPAARWFMRIGDVCPVVMTKGNHDQLLDCALLAHLKARHPIIVEERAAVHRVGPASIACVAWPNRSSIAAMMGRPLPTDALDSVAREALCNVFRGLALELEENTTGPRIGLGHFMVDGSITSTGQPLIGKPLNIGLSDLALLGVEAIVMDHIHAAQEWWIRDVPVLYTGSPYRKTFGEMEPKSVTLLEFEGSKLVRFERIPTPATPMVHVEGNFMLLGETGKLGERLLATRFDGKDWHPFGPSGWGELVHGAEVRLRYRVDIEHREAAERAARDWARIAIDDAKAKSVKVEQEVNVRQRSRLQQMQIDAAPPPADGEAPEADEAFDATAQPALSLSSAKTIADKLELMWRARGFDPGARREPMMSKLAMLEEEVRLEN